MGVLSVAVVLVLVLSMAAGAWVARRQHRIGAAAGRFSQLDMSRRVSMWVSQRGWQQAAARRLGVGEAAALALAAGLALVVALAVGFTYLLDSVLDGDGITAVDQPAARWVAGHRDGWLTAAMRVITHAGDPLTVAALATVVCVGMAWWRRSWLPLVLGVLGAGGIALVVMAVKLMVGRPRPPLPFAAIAENGYSFPSGHATGIMVAVALVGWMVTRWVIRSWTGRVLVWTAAALVIGVVGFSRVYLGVHYLSDVAAGWLLGAVWAGTLAQAGGWWEAARGTARTPPDGGQQALDDSAAGASRLPMHAGSRPEPHDGGASEPAR